MISSSSVNYGLCSTEKFMYVNQNGKNPFIQVLDDGIHNDIEACAQLLKYMNVEWQ